MCEYNVVRAVGYWEHLLGRRTGSNVHVHVCTVPAGGWNMSRRGK